MWRDEKRTLAEIARFSSRDAEAYPKFEAYLERIARVVEGLLLTTPPEFPPSRPSDFIEYLKLLGRFRGLTRDQLVSLVKIFTQSASDLLDEWFESAEVKVTLATDGVIGANGGPRSPGTAYILLHHVMGGVGGQRGLWGFVRGGMGAVSNAIAMAARVNGAELRVNASVAKVLVRGGRARGVVLASGEEIAARIVASKPRPEIDVFAACGSRRTAAGICRSHSPVPLRRHVVQDQPGPVGLSRVQGLPGRAWAATSRHDAHLPVHPVCGARMGRRQVRAALATADAGVDHADGLRSVACA
jgi:phytoene dehydrogenase-like protein